MKPRARQCKKCLRRFKFGGQGFTRWNCQRCGEEQMSGSTAHPRVCTPCAIKENRCYWCGEEIK